MMLRHAVSTSILRSFFSVFGKLDPLHMTIEFVPSLIFRTKPPFGPTESSTPCLICASRASFVIFGHASPPLAELFEFVDGELDEKKAELLCGSCGGGCDVCTNGEAPSAAIFAAHSSRVFGQPSPAAAADEPG